MTRPIIMLQEWLEKERGMKWQFIEQELKYSGLLSAQTENGNYTHITDRFPNDLLTERAFIDGTQIQLSKFCFDKLKAKYRTFKSKKKDSSLIKKQYKLSKETINTIQQIKIEYSFPREENVIENIVNGHINQKNIQKKIEKLKPKEIDLEALNFIIQEYKKEIDNLKLENKNLEKENKSISYLLAASYLKNEYLKDNLQDQDIISKWPIPSDEQIRNKILEIINLLKEGE